MKRYVSLLAFIALVFSVSFVSSSITMPAVQSWYQEIEKAAWNPPDYVFAPVWTTLYLMIAIAGWRVWQKLSGDLRTRLTHPAMRVYWLQLLCNFLWSVLFFGMMSFIAAFIDIVLLLIAIALTIRAFRAIDKWAAYLLVPYFLWVLYASTLNAAIAILN